MPLDDIASAEGSGRVDIEQPYSDERRRALERFERTYTLALLERHKNKVAQAENKVARTLRENASNMAQKVANAQTSEQALVLRKRLVEKLQQQLDAWNSQASS